MDRSDSRLHTAKLRALDFALTTAVPDARHVLDLGGVWGVEGGYAFAAADYPGIERATIVDSEHGVETKRRCEARDSVRYVQGEFANPDVVDAAGEHDVTLMFDVLLHQVCPSWDEVLRIYADRTRCFVIANPQWARDDTCFRLLDLGPDRYSALVPNSGDEAETRAMFARLDEPLDPGGRPLRDLHNLWQWAISDPHLHAVMTSMNFERVYSHDAGAFVPGSPFRRRNFVYVRRDRT